MMCEIWVRVLWTDWGSFHCGFLVTLLTLVYGGLNLAQLVESRYAPDHGFCGTHQNILKVPFLWWARKRNNFPFSLNLKFPPLESFGNFAALEKTFPMDMVVD